MATDNDFIVRKGNVGIGERQPSAKLHVVGDGYFTGDVVAYYSSDRTLKDNLTVIENATEKISQIHGYEFDWNMEAQSVHKGHDVGVVAQEIEAILPEVVVTRENGTKAVKYEKLVALLIQGAKEQQDRIQELEKQIEALKNQSILSKLFGR